MEQILYYELGENLLRSWFVVSSASSGRSEERSFRFATRWENYFDELTIHLDRLLLSSAKSGIVAALMPEDSFIPLEPKFSWAVERSIDEDEKLGPMVFEPAQFVRWRFFKKPIRPARGLCLTSKRLLWLEEEREGQYLEYGVSRRTIPLRRIESLSLQAAPQAGARSELVIRLSAPGGKQELRFPVSEEWLRRYAQLIDQIDVQRRMAVA